MAHQDYHQGAHNIHHLHLPYRLLWVFPTLNVKDLSPSSVLRSHFAESVSLQGSLAKAFWRCGESGTGGRSRIVWCPPITWSSSTNRFRTCGNGLRTRTALLISSTRRIGHPQLLHSYVPTTSAKYFLKPRMSDIYHFLDSPNGIDNDDDNTV